MLNDWLKFSSDRLQIAFNRSYFNIFMNFMKKNLIFFFFGKSLENYKNFFFNIIPQWSWKYFEREKISSRKKSKTFEKKFQQKIQKIFLSRIMHSKETFHHSQSSNEEKKIMTSILRDTSNLQFRILLGKKKLFELKNHMIQYEFYIYF